ncbi:hypothetical protein FB446DRAFT_750150 [Lentinula raphanica]|nr:hypothetical protein FB446DRAFT_750150 [Lentinula raphanica]
MPNRLFRPIPCALDSLHMASTFFFRLFFLLFRLCSVQVIYTCQVRNSLKKFPSVHNGPQPLPLNCRDCTSLSYVCMLSS